MKNLFYSRLFRGTLVSLPLVLLWAGVRARAQNETFTPGAARSEVDAAANAVDAIARPRYRIVASVDYQLLTLKSTAQITVPVAPGDALQDAVFYVFANASGVGGDDGSHPHIVVDRASLDGVAVPFSIDGALVRVRLPEAKRAAFTLKIDTHGVIPRSPAGAGGLADLMGGMGDLGDMGGLGGMLGDTGGALGGDKAEAPKNTDYGLYTYGNGILSLGSFWYPVLAVRQNGKWADDQPEGLGDVAFSEMSDYEVAFNVPANVTVAATGERLERNIDWSESKAPDAPDGMARLPGGQPGHQVVFVAQNVRDFAALMSDGWTVASKKFDVGGKSVTVEAYTLKKDAARGAQVIDVAGHALQVYSKRFGPYLYDTFKVVEGPIKGGAGGMEFSGLTSIASMLYGDMGKQLQGLAGALAGDAGGGDIEKMLGDGEDAGQSAPKQAVPKVAAPKVAAPDADAGANPASDLLKGMLGEQQEIFDSLLEETIAHETAHQWWAIGVGSDSRHAPFVDESLTNYSSMVYFEDRYGRDKAAKMMELHLKTPYSMGRMLGGGDAPVNLKTSAYKNSLQYGAIVYGKGALFYDALRQAVGDEVFFGALRDYYAQYDGKLVGPRTLLEVVKARAGAAQGAKLDALYHRWIEETHGDDDITGGKATSVEDLLGGLMGGAAGGDE